MTPQDPGARRGLLFALAAAAVARIPALLLATEHYGDAPVRIEAAERWARDPHLWHGFSEAFQYGPLHLSLLGGAVALFGRFLGPKLLSLAFGLGGVVLLYVLARRIAGPRAALVAALALAVSPLHVQASTTGASEAVFLTLLLGALLLVLDARTADAPGRLLAAAALLGVASLVRYDGLLYVGLFAALLGWDALAVRSPARFVRAGLFFAAALVLPALWFWQCARADGHALSALRHIDADHRGLADAAIRWFGAAKYRVYCLGYWPASALVIATPLVGLFAMAGAFRSLGGWLRGLPRPPSDAQAVALLAWVPALYFTLRGAVLLDFRPMVRFAMVAAALSLPFAWGTFGDLAQRLRPSAGRALAALAFAAMVTAPIALAAASYRRNGNAAEWSRPFSPISTVPPGVKDAADWVKRRTRGTSDVVLLDQTWHFLDIPLAFDTALPEERVVRRAWPDFEAHAKRTPPTLAVVLDGGMLKSTPGVEGAVPGAERFTFRGTAFCAASHFTYASVYERCAR